MVATQFSCSRRRRQTGRRHLICGKTLRQFRSLPGADGMKTGYTCASGYNIVASATREGHRIIAVVMGEPSKPARNARAAALIEHGFRIYGWKSVFPHRPLRQLPEQYYPRRL